MKVLVVLAITVAMAFAFPQGGVNTILVQDQPFPTTTTFIQQPNQQTSYIQGPPQYVVQQHQVTQQEPQKKPGLLGSLFGGVAQGPAAILAAPIAVGSALFQGVGQGLLAAGQAGTKGSTTAYLNVAESG